MAKGNDGSDEIVRARKGMIQQVEEDLQKTIDQTEGKVPFHSTIEITNSPLSLCVP